MYEKWTFGGFDRSIPDSFSSPIHLNMSRGPVIPKKCPKLATKFLKLAPNFPKIQPKLMKNLAKYMFLYTFFIRHRAFDPSRHDVECSGLQFLP